jgi:hypothetical protein
MGLWCDSIGVNGAIGVSGVKDIENLLIDG